MVISVLSWCWNVIEKWSHPCVDAGHHGQIQKHVTPSHHASLMHLLHIHALVYDLSTRHWWTYTDMKNTGGNWREERLSLLDRNTIILKQKSVFWGKKPWHLITAFMWLGRIFTSLNPQLCLMASDHLPLDYIPEVFCGLWSGLLVMTGVIWNMVLLENQILRAREHPQSRKKQVFFQENLVHSLDSFHKQLPLAEAPDHQSVSSQIYSGCETLSL